MESLNDTDSSKYENDYSYDDKWVIHTKDKREKSKDKRTGHSSEIQREFLDSGDFSSHSGIYIVRDQSWDHGADKR